MNNEQQTISSTLDYFIERLAALETHRSSTASSFTPSTSSDLDLNQLLSLGNGLDVTGLTVLRGGLQVEYIGSPGTVLSILSDVIFFGTPYFNKNAGGFVVVRAGTGKQMWSLSVNTFPGQWSM